jgi:hypothetical protein
MMLPLNLYLQLNATIALWANDLFSSTLSCNKKEEKNHQTSHFVRARFNQPSNFDQAPLAVSKTKILSSPYFD